LIIICFFAKTCPFLIYTVLGFFLIPEKPKTLFVYTQSIKTHVSIAPKLY
jgi:hypothetical protein